MRPYQHPEADQRFMAAYTVKSAADIQAWAHDHAVADEEWERDVFLRGMPGLCSERYEECFIVAVPVGTTADDPKARVLPRSGARARYVGFFAGDPDSASAIKEALHPF